MKSVKKSNSIKSHWLGLFIIIFTTFASVFSFQFAKYNLQEAETILIKNPLLKESSAPDLNELKSVQKQLKAVVSKLEKIPYLPILFDSQIQVVLARLHTRLAAIEQQLKTEEQSLSNLETAQNLANEASQLAQQSPLSLENLVKSQKKWQEVLNLLKVIPANASNATQARERLLTYRENNTTVTAKITQEEKAINILRTASQSAEQAENLTRNQLNYTASILLNAKAAWQQVIELLQSIPSDSIAIAEAKTQLANFQTNIQNIDAGLKQIEQCQANDPVLNKCNISLNIIGPPTATASVKKEENNSSSSSISTANTEESDSSSSSYSPSYVPGYSSSSSSDSIYVRPYTRSDGTYVRGHYRSRSGSSSRVGGFGSSRSYGSSS